ncbi:hypothetical protein L6R52_09405 [Myxococcota bacterium]|nr:hypothetical protein [Myxococcota bacterium]
MRSFRALLAIGLFLGASACAKQKIAHEQIEKDSNEIVLLLNQNGIEAEAVKNEESRDLRFDVQVSRDAVAAALAVMQRYNLPKQRADDTSAMFKEGGMIPTSEQQRAKREVGIRGDIINSLRAVPRVVDVQATVTIPEDNPLRDPSEAKPKPKASVLVIYLDDAEGKPPIPVEEVQKFVQASLPEIKSAEVSVNMFPIAQPGTTMGASGVPIAIDPGKGCLEKEVVIGIEVCKGQKSKVSNLILASVVVAGLLSGMVIFAVLRAMRYRKDLTRLTAQFEKVKTK